MTDNETAVGTRRTTKDCTGVAVFAEKLGQLIGAELYGRATAQDAESTVNDRRVAEPPLK